MVVGWFDGGEVGLGWMEGGQGRGTAGVWQEDPAPASEDGRRATRRRPREALLRGALPPLGRALRKRSAWISDLGTAGRGGWVDGCGGRQWTGVATGTPPLTCAAKDGIQCRRVQFAAPRLIQGHRRWLRHRAPCVTAQATGAGEGTVNAREGLWRWLAGRQATVSPKLTHGLQT